MAVHEPVGPFASNGARKDGAEEKNSRTCRVALYSPGMVGLGHMRRNLQIAQVLSFSPFRPAILMIAEAREAAAYALPRRVDCLTLPALRKEQSGQCRGRYLEVSLEELGALRAKVIRDALETFAPDVLIADHLPRGALRELEPALESLRARGHTRCVLGLRDVLDDPETVHREWFRANNENAIRRYYDAVWVYGDPAVYDLVREYHFPLDLAAKVRYTGYLTPPIQTTFAEIDGAELLTAVAGPTDRLVLCMLGGGQDGAFLAEAFAQVDFPPGTKGVILTGPFMPPEVRHCLYRRAGANPQLRVVKFVTDPDILLSLADRVVTMGGYNTTYEVLVAEKPALIVPRTGPRREQLIRAERLRQLGLVDVLPQDRLSSAALMEWLGRDPGPRPRVLGRIDFQGAERLPRLLAEVLHRPPCRPGAQPREERLKHVRH